MLFGVIAKVNFATTPSRRRRNLCVCGIIFICSACFVFVRLMKDRKENQNGRSGLTTIAAAVCKTMQCARIYGRISIRYDDPKAYPPNAMRM